MNFKFRHKIVIPVLLSGIVILSLFTFVGFSILNTSNLLGGYETLPTDSPAINMTGMFLTVSGEIQGDIRGDVTLADRVDTIFILAYIHSIIVPFDEKTGSVIDTAKHSPFVLTKYIDETTPLLMNALTKNENLPSWRLDFWGINSTGQEVNFFTIELTNARIVSIRQYATDTATERISFVYEIITWTWQLSGIIAEDTWSPPQ